MSHCQNISNAIYWRKFTKGKKKKYWERKRMREIAHFLIWRCLCCICMQETKMNKHIYKCNKSVQQWQQPAWCNRFQGFMLYLCLLLNNFIFMPLNLIQLAWSTRSLLAPAYIIILTFGTIFTFNLFGICWECQ